MSDQVVVAPRSRASLRQSWLERLDRFAKAGLSVVAFCRSEGISTQAFYYWKHKLTQTGTAAEAPRLLPVHLHPAASAVELVLPTGAVLRLAPGCDLAFVRCLVAALGEPPC
jgi:transposase-like protein